jgi:signal transduction histidine kinase
MYRNKISKELHDELANDVFYALLHKIYRINEKETLLDNLDKIYI